MTLIELSVDFNSYSLPWETFPKSCIKMLNVIQMNCNSPCAINAFGLLELGLEYYIKVYNHAINVQNCIRTITVGCLEEVKMIFILKFSKLKFEL